MKNKIYHNPRCSKSRQTLKLIQENNTEIEIVEYLKTPPSAAEIKELCSKIGITPKELIRFNESIAKDLGLKNSTDKQDNEWCRIMAEYPKLIERPIVVLNGKAILGRPPEKVLDII